jgi:hypothetical protein
LIAIFILTLGFIIPGALPGIIIVQFFFSLCFGIYSISNNQFMMQTASSDIRGMVSGCMQAFRETGLAIGIALVNLSNDVYMELNWEHAVPIDDSCSTERFVEYREVYYRSFCATNIVMSFVALVALLLAVLSGTNEHEKRLFGYPKKLLLAAKEDGLLLNGRDEPKEEEVVEMFEM